ncbi:putative ribonuclease H-like domain-containing protein [Tanacetum coccineum]
MDNRRGTIDKTLFLKKDKHDIILVQVYVDDIIFGSTKKSWCDEFEALMKSRFQMSSMGELTFFLGLQVKQNKMTASTPIETQKPLVKDEEASDVDVHLYRSMIGSLMYLTASRPDIMFAVCACSRFQVTPKSSHLSAVKRIFSDYAGANLDMKSSTGRLSILGREALTLSNKIAKPLWLLYYRSRDGCSCKLLWASFYGFKIKRSDRKEEFHEIIDFLKRSSIHHALTVSHVVSTTFVEQFWTSAKSKTINNVRHITAKVAEQSLCPILRASIRSCTKVSDQAKEIQDLKAQITKLKKQAKPSYNNINQAEKSPVSRQGRSLLKDNPIVQRDPLLNELPQIQFDHMENSEHAQNEGRTREMVDEDKEFDENILSTEDVLSTNKDGVSTDMDKCTEEQVESTDGPFRNEKKFKQLESDEEMARKIQEEWEVEEERNRIAEEKAANEALIRNFDDIKARIEADRLLAEKLQEQEREQFTIEERAKFLHDTIDWLQRKFLAQQRSEAIRNRPPTKNQLRNQMMTYLKHVGNFKHAELKIKKFEEVQSFLRRIKRMNEKGVDFSKDEMVKEKSKAEVKEESKEEESKKKRKLGTRKKMKSRKRRYIQNTSEDDSDKENDELRLHLTIAPDEVKRSDYEILDRKYLIKEWKTECLGTKPQTDQAEHIEEINQNVVIRSNGQKRYFSTLMRVLSIFDREDLNAVYQLVMDRYQDEIPEGFDRVLWGDLMVMFNPDRKVSGLEMHSYENKRLANCEFGSFI